MLILHCVADTYEAYTTQTYAAFVLLDNRHKNDAADGQCTKEIRCQTTDKSFQQWVSFVESVPSIPVCSAVVKSIDGTLQTVLNAVQLAQGFMMMSGILDILDDEDEIESH